ncbi:hypothetical protein BG842_20445 [Haladaptatus sp. W1]|uniref:hypothetical protein n=1 Tax=Haladaptatus sp. W1 TaxID=1897478 RepID=UPI0008497E47|nr:hypothetical protein BG842_20445 [Haladaptatus sp. W1]
MYLVDVDETEPNDLFVGMTEYFSESYLRNRGYEGGEHSSGWMQDSVFELFDQEGRLSCWRISSE